MSSPKYIVLTAQKTPETEYDCACPDMPVTLTATPSKHEEDCACPDTPLKITTVPISATPSTHSPLRLTPQLYTDTLPHGYTLAFSPYSPAGPSVLNRAAFARLQAFQTPQPPVEAVDFTLAAQNLLVPVDTLPEMAWGRVSTLTAWLHVTNACNLDCPYCYVRKSTAHMSEATGEQVLDRIFRSAVQHGFQTVKLKYAGGEAALHFNMVQHLHHYAQSLATRHHLDLQAVVLSNGTVWMPPMAHWLRENGVKLMISLDGTGAAHDAMRPTAGGKGSFAQIEKTVDTVLLPAGIRPDISITVSGSNAGAAADAVAWAIERDLPFSLNFYRENALSADRHILQLEEARIIAGMRHAYQVIAAQLPTRPFMNGLLDRAQMDAHTHTCGVGQNYVVFSHSGAVHQCQMQLANGVSLPVNTDLLAQVENGKIPKISVDEKDGCRTCLWRYRCTGGCPLETYRATGRYDVKSPHCNIYTALFPEVLRLEGLRLLKKAGVLPA